MKIGILTYHDEVNYGSLLQAYAMQTALRDFGHESVIIDRWFQPRQDRIYGILHSRSLREWMGWIRRALWCSGAFSLFLRQWRSRAFIKKHLRLTSYSFHDCAEAPSDLGVDLVTVGSDQVWHPCAQPDVYLLCGLKQVPGIAYAASFGANVIPQEMEALYRDGFKNFSAIGVREQEGVEMVRKLGVDDVAHVVDPTILVNPKCWKKLVGEIKKSGKKKLACYFLDEDHLEIAKQLGCWAKENNAEVDLFLQDFFCPWRGFFPDFNYLFKYWKCRLIYPLRFRYAAGPIEFLRKIANSDCVLTNSFHALMFSIIFRRNVRIVKPSASIRKGMSARMQEFSGSIIKGPLVVDNLDAALNSYGRGEHVTYDEDVLSQRRRDSEAWLQKAIRKATTVHNG